MSCTCILLKFYFILDGDALFLHLCQLLAVNAGNLNVVASPLRVTILEVNVHIVCGYVCMMDCECKCTCIKVLITHNSIYIMYTN